MRDNPMMDYFNRLLQAYDGEFYGQTPCEDLAASLSNPEQTPIVVTVLNSQYLLDNEDGIYTLRPERHPRSNGSKAFE